jgi:hypothetical protein
MKESWGRSWEQQQMVEEQTSKSNSHRRKSRPAAATSARGGRSRPAATATRGGALEQQQPVEEKIRCIRNRRRCHGIAAAPAKGEDWVRVRIRFGFHRGKLAA